MPGTKIKQRKLLSLAFVRKLFTISFLEKILVKFSQDQKLNSIIGKLIPENHQYPSNTFRTVTRNGIIYKLDISDYQNWLIYFGVTDDSPNSLYDLVKPNSYLFDIGTNIGQTILNFARLSGPDSMIIGFEPDPVNYSRMLQNIELNPFKNIKCYNIALGSVKGQFPLKINSPLNRGGNRISSKETLHDSFLVDVERLDDFVANNNIPKVDLIKIDVEGFEHEILKGGAKTIQQFKPVMFIEVDNSNLQEQNTSAAELINYIRELGYQKILIAGSEILITSNSMIPQTHFDIICEAEN
ncbi:MAG: methyltransferase FkbM family [Bacteroidetes bacterium]|jgi:FkbM family methyltransferase|nr:methyltransferase FkbM family [Bacteroidota bacterium]